LLVTHAITGQKKNRALGIQTVMDSFALIDIELFCLVGTICRGETDSIVKSLPLPPMFLRIPKKRSFCELAWSKLAIFQWINRLA